MNIREYWTAVANLGCCVSRTTYNVTLHHIHGGSVKGLRGAGMKSSDWLVIPLASWLHTGQYGIDGSMGVPAWETRFGTQLQHVQWVRERMLPFGVDSFRQAGVHLDHDGILRITVDMLDPLCNNYSSTGEHD